MMQAAGQKIASGYIELNTSPGDRKASGCREIFGFPYENPAIYCQLR